jgi:hypothetical protein
MTANALATNRMAEPDSVSLRLKEARFRTAANLRETVSQDRMAELIGEHLKRVFHPTQWRRYEGGVEPPLEIIRAVAAVSGLPEAYIAFGVKTGDVVIDPTRDRLLTETGPNSDRERAARAAADEAKRSGRKDPKKKGKAS